MHTPHSFYETETRFKLDFPDAFFIHQREQSRHEANMAVLRDAHASLVATEKEAAETALKLKEQRKQIEHVNENVSLFEWRDFLLSLTWNSRQIN